MQKDLMIFLDILSSRCNFRDSELWDELIPFAVLCCTVSYYLPWFRMVPHGFTVGVLSARCGWCCAGPGPRREENHDGRLRSGGASRRRIIGQVWMVLRRRILLFINILCLVGREQSSMTLKVGRTP